MPLNRTADQLLNDQFGPLLIRSLAAAAGTYHLGPAANPGDANLMYDLRAGAPTVGHTLYAAGKFLNLVIDITNANGGNLTATIVGLDPVSGKSYPVLVSAALAANATTVLKVGPGLTAVANLTANDFLPFTWSAQIVVAVATMTFSIGAQMMP